MAKIIHLSLYIICLLGCVQNPLLVPGRYTVIDSPTGCDEIWIESDSSMTVVSSDGMTFITYELKYQNKEIWLYEHPSFENVDIEFKIIKKGVKGFLIEFNQRSIEIVYNGAISSDEIMVVKGKKSLRNSTVGERISNCLMNSKKFNY